MSLTVVAVVVGGAIGLLLGGRPRHLATWRLRSWALLIPGLGLQLAADRWPLGGLGTIVAVAGYACLLAFAARNALLVGMSVVAVGLAANMAVVALNDGMPVHGPAIVAAGIATRSQLPDVTFGQRHHLEGAVDHVSFLDDRIPIGGLHEVVSIGDLILVAGAADVAANAVRRPRRRRATWVRPDFAALRPSPAHRSVERLRSALRRLQVAIQPVEHGAGNGVLEGSAVGQSPPALAGGSVDHDHEDAGAKVG